jgi:DNA polymerase-3 subunit epsilon
VDVTTYAALAGRARAAMQGDVREVVAAVERRMEGLASTCRYEDAAAWRGRLAEFVRAADRTHRLGLLAELPELVAARPTADRGWEVHVVRHGRLAAAAAVPPREDPRPTVDALVAAAEVVVPAPPPAPAGLAEEATRVLRWLESEGVRLVRSGTGLALPVHGGGRDAARLASVESTLPGWRGRRDEGAAVSRPRGAGGGPLGPAGPTRIALDGPGRSPAA